MPPKLPFDPRERNEPDSDRPERDERPFRRPATAFVTRAEVEQMITEAMREVLGPIRRVEAMARESRDELREAKRERELRAQWDREQREREQIEAVREKTRSESDLAAALQRPQTPLQFLPVAIPKAADSDPILKKPMSKSMRWVALLVPVIVAIIMAVSAVVSNRSNPHGAQAAPQGHTP